MNVKGDNMIEATDLGTVIVINSMGKVYEFQNVEQPLPAEGGGVIVRKETGYLIFSSYGFITCEWIPNEVGDD